MAYTDDMVLLADSKGDMEELLRSFDSTFSSMGLTVSTAKTKVLAILPSGQTEPAVPLTFHPGEGEILGMDTFLYLGCLMEKNCSVDAEVNFRIKKPQGFSVHSAGSCGIKKGSAAQLSYVYIKLLSSWCGCTDWKVQRFFPTTSDASKHSTKDVSASSWGFHYGRRGGIHLSEYRSSRNVLKPP